MQTKIIIWIFVLILLLTSGEAAKFQYYSDELPGMHDLPRKTGEYVYSSWALGTTSNFIDPKNGISISNWSGHDLCSGIGFSDHYTPTEISSFDTKITATSTQRRRLINSGYSGTTMYCNFNVDNILNKTSYPVAVYIWVLRNTAQAATFTLQGRKSILDFFYTGPKFSGTKMEQNTYLSVQKLILRNANNLKVTVSLNDGTAADVYQELDSDVKFKVTFAEGSKVYMSYIQVNIVPDSTPLPNYFINNSRSHCDHNSECFPGHVCSGQRGNCNGLLNPVCEKTEPDATGEAYPQEDCDANCSIFTKNLSKTGGRNPTCNPIAIVDVTQFSQMKSPSFNKKLSNAYTMGMWLFIENLSKLNTKLINFSLSNIIMISVGAASSQVVAYCTPYIAYYPQLQTKYSQSEMDQMSISTPYYGLGKVATDHTADRWLYVSCGFDLDALSMTVMIHNQTWETPPVKSEIDLSSKKPLFYSTPDKDIVMDFFFRSYQKTYLSITQDNTIYDTSTKTGSVYLKLLSVFTDKLPISSNFPWYFFELSSIGSTNTILKSLWMYGIDVVGKDLNSATMSVYTYSTNFKQTTQSSNINYVNGAHLNTPDKLYRLYFTSINKYFKDWVHLDTGDLTCNTGDVCWDDNSPLSCKTRSFYDLTQTNPTKVCQSRCPDTTKPQISPLDSGHTTSEYCTSPCGTAKPSVQCFPADEDYPDNTNNFQCAENYTKINMDCISNNITEKGAFFFSRYFGTPADITLPISPPLTNYAIEFWFFFDKVFSPQKQIPDDQPNYIWYTSDISIRKDSSDHTLLSDFNIYRGNTQINSVAFTYNPGQWHRIRYSVSDTKFYFYHVGDEPDLELSSLSEKTGRLSWIRFCNESKCQALGFNFIYWSSGYYRNIKVWKETALDKLDKFFFNEYDKFFKFFNAPFPRFSNVVNYYPLNLYNLKNYKITDPIVTGNSAKFDYPVNSDEYKTSPFPGYNYAVDFDLTTDGKYADSITLGTDIYTATLGNCEEPCKYCKEGECHECRQDFLLTGGQCLSDVDNQKYYLRSPVFFDGSPIDLVYKPMLLQNTDLAFSVSFFVKVLGRTFSKSSYASYDIIRFGNNLKLAYNVKEDEDKLQLINASTREIFAEYSNFSSHKAKWINISLAYYYNAAINDYFPAMMNFQVHFLNIPISSTVSKNGLQVSEITIPKESIAIYAKIWIWNVYINGPWSEMVNAGRKFPPNFILAEGTSFDSCYNTIYVQSPTEPSIEPCVIDVGNDTDALNETKWCPSDQVSFASNSSGCLAPDEKCLYGYYSIRDGETPSNLCGCASDKNINSIHIWNNSENNYCAKNDAQDFGQITSLTVSNVLSGSEEYTLGFWVYVQTYVPNTNFGFEIAWNTQLQLKLGYNGSVITSECFPLYQEGNASYTTQSDIIDLPTSPSQWVSITCAVSRTYKVFYHLQHLQTTNQKTLNNLPGPTVISPTTLVFTNNSINRGIILIRHIALWNSYFCLSQNLFQIDIENVKYYTNLLHLWDLPSSSNTIADIKSGVTMTITADESWIGYNILEDSGYATLSTLNVLCEVGNYCHTLIKLNEFDDMKVPVDPSTNGRYTIEMWTAVDNIENLNMGYHVRWQNLNAISVIPSVETSDTLNMYCWPQDFRMNLNSAYGKQKINDLTLTTLNYAAVSTTSYTNKTWKWVRCAVSYDSNNFYLNNQTIKQISGDYMGSDEKSDNPIRYFWQNEEKTQLIISGAKLNQSPISIYIRLIYLFNDYLPQNHLFSHLNIGALTGTFFPSLIFSMDFKSYCYQLNRILINYKNSGSAYVPTIATELLSYDKELNDVELCAVGDRFSEDGTCVAISSCGSSTTTEVCADENIPLVCKPSYHWDPKPTPSCVQVCSTGLMRSPSSSTTSALCNMDCDQFYEKCPATADEEMNLYSSIKCKAGYTRYGYKCIENTIATNNAYLYFNGCTNFPNGSYPFRSNRKIDNGYLISFWIKLDRFNEWCSYENKKKVYFLLEPHVIYLDTQSSTYAQSKEALPEGFYNLVYENLQKSEIRATLMSFSPWNWNHIIIHYNKPLKFLKIYSNYRIHIPDLSIENLSDSNFGLTKLLFCSGNTPCSSYKSLENIIWGAAFYKNLKIFEGTNSNPWLALETELKTFTDDIHPFRFDFPFNVINSVDSVIPNLKQSDKIDFYNSYHNGDIDKDILINYSLNFDYSQQYPGKYVSSYDLNTGELVGSDCAKNCKRCVSNLYTQCVECNTGYKLFSGQCKAYNGYFVRTPIQKYSQKLLSLNLNAQGFEVENEYTMTMTIWIKFFGVLSTANTNCAIIVQLKPDETYICYDSSSQTLSVYVDYMPLFTDSTVFSSLIGQWTLLSLATTRNKRANIPELETYFPPFASFNVQYTEIPRNQDFTINTPELAFDSFDLGNEISALFSDLKIYKTFIVNPYGYIFNEQSTTRLVFRVPLTSISPETSCISNDNLNVEYYSDIDLESNIKDYVSQLEISCIADYNPYLSTICDQYHWIDTKYFSESDTPCSSCSQFCKNGCAYNDKENSGNGCVCSSDTVNHWFKSDTTTKKLSCENVPQYDFSRGTTVAQGVKVASEGKYTTEFWFYIYSYSKTSIVFDSFELIWDLHNYIRIFNGGNNSLYGYCVPIYNHQERNLYIGPEVSTTNSVNTKPDSMYGITDNLNEAYFKWVFVQCSTNIPRNVTYINQQVQEKIPYYQTTLPNLQTVSQTQLIIQPGYKSKVNFGFLFIRELKLWSQWDIRQFTSTCQNANDAITIFKSTLMHYFNTETNEQMTAIFDSASRVPGALVLSKDFVGYNLIEDVTTTSLLMPTMSNCYTLSVNPTEGYNILTEFTLSLQANIPIFGAVKCSYRRKETDGLFVFGLSLTSQITSKFAVPALASDESSNILVEIYCMVIFEDSSFTTIYHLFSLKPEPSVDQVLNDQSAITTLTSSLSDEQLANKVEIMVSVITKQDAAFDTSDSSYSIQLDTTPAGTVSGSTISLISPTCADYPNYCNGNGICISQQEKLICKCYGTVTGGNCQFTEDSAKKLAAYIFSFLEQIRYRINYSLNQGNTATRILTDSEITDQITNTELININLVKTATKLLTLKIAYSHNLTDITPFMDIVELLLNQTQIGEQLKINFNEYCDILNVMFKSSQENIVRMKYFNLEECILYNMTSSCADYSKVEYQIVNITQNNTTTLRQLQSSNDNSTTQIIQVNDTSKQYLSLTTEQKSEYSAFLTKIENSVMTITREVIKAASRTELEYNYNSTGINVNLKKIKNGNFDFVQYFTSLNKTREYKGYFDAKYCIQQYFLSNADPIFLVYLYYAIPFQSYDTSMLSSLISPTHKILFLNSAGEEIALNCTKDIVHYLPLLPLHNSEFFNYYNTYPFKYNQTSPTIARGVYPVYNIYPNGTIDHSAFSIQFAKYYNKYNLVLKRYTNDSVGYDETQSSQHNFTYINNQRYLVGFSNQLGEFGAFTELNTKVQYDKPFNFVHSPQILNCSENYIYNLCFYIAVILLGLYLIVLTLAFFLRNTRKSMDKMIDFISEIKEEMIMIGKDNERVGDNRYSFYIPNQTNEQEPVKVAQMKSKSNNRIRFNEEQDINSEIPKEPEQNCAPIKVPSEDLGGNSEERELKSPTHSHRENGLDKLNYGSNKELINHEYIPISIAPDTQPISEKKNCYNPLFFILARNIYSNTILMKSPFMPRYLYLSKLMFLVFLQFALATIIFVFVEFNFMDEVAYNSGRLGSYIVFAVVAANLPMLLLCFLISTNSSIRRRLVSLSNEIIISPAEREEIIAQSSSIMWKSIVKACICNFMTFCSWVVIYYLSVGFCAFWKQWSHVMVLLWLFCLITDFLFMEVILECLIFAFYLAHKKSRVMNKIYKFLLAIRQLRNYG